jgi:iron complex transport system substrate-binding protein
MAYRMTLVAAIVLVFALSAVARRRLDEGLRQEVALARPCRRIVSMAPSITETLYELGLGDRVVGVTRDCKYPPAVERVKRRSGDIGGYFDPNFEAILALKPDLIVMLKEQSNLLPAFQRLKLETLVVSHQTTDGIIESFRTIGRVCGRGAEGRQMEREFRSRVDRIRAATRDLARPRVLFVLGRTYGCGHPADLFVAADDDYIDTIIQWAGAENAYRRRGVRYPVLSAEGILRLNPDVIVDLVPPEKLQKIGRQAILDDWKELKSVKAVKDGRVLIPEGDFAFIPGPRFLELVEYLARAIHPEAPWDNWDEMEFPHGH